jgi:hypothetical protein
MSARRLPPFFLSLVVMIALVFVALIALVGVRLGLSGLGMLLGFGAYFLLVHVYLPYRVYVDARERGRDSGRATAWAAATFFVPVLVALLYFLLVSREES